jgi:hypothetical protein
MGILRALCGEVAIYKSNAHYLMDGHLVVPVTTMRSTTLGDPELNMQNCPLRINTLWLANG